jgi:hypothetical protein
MNRITPNGGVMAPMIRLTDMTMPKWTGSIPTAVMIGQQRRSDDQQDCRRLHEATQEQQ